MIPAEGLNLLEDVDFGWRSWLAEQRVLYEPSAVVRHESSATSSRLGDFERGVLFERNALQTVLKNYEEDLLRETSAMVASRISKPVAQVF